MRFPAYNHDANVRHRFSHALIVKTIQPEDNIDAILNIKRRLVDGYYGLC